MWTWAAASLLLRMRTKVNRSLFLTFWRMLSKARPQQFQYSLPGISIRRRVKHTFLDFIHNALEEFGVRFLLDGMAKDASIMFYRIARRAARISAMKKRQFQITRCSQETLRFLWSVLRYGSLLPLCGMRGP